MSRVDITTKERPSTYEERTGNVINSFMNDICVITVGYILLVALLMISLKGFWPNFVAPAKQSAT